MWADLGSPDRTMDRTRLCDTHPWITALSVNAQNGLDPSTTTFQRGRSGWSNHKMQKEVIRKLSYCHTLGFCSYSFFLALAPKKAHSRFQETSMSCGEICQSSGSGVGRRNWEIMDMIPYYYSVVYLSRLDPAPNRMAPDFLSIGKLR